MKWPKKRQCFAEDESLTYLIQRMYLRQGCIKMVWANVYIFSQPTTKHLCILDLLFFKQSQYTIFLCNSAHEDLFLRTYFDLFQEYPKYLCLFPVLFRTRQDSNRQSYCQEVSWIAKWLEKQESLFCHSSCCTNCQCTTVWLTLPLLAIISSLGKCWRCKTSPLPGGRPFAKNKPNLSALCSFHSTYYLFLYSRKPTKLLSLCYGNPK